MMEVVESAGQALEQGTEDAWFGSDSSNHGTSDTLTCYFPLLQAAIAALALYSD